MKSKGLVTLTALCLLVLTAVPASAGNASTPYVITGWVFYENETACDDPVVDITNTDNGRVWQAGTHTGYNYYLVALANGTDFNSSEILQFDLRDSSSTQLKSLNHIITQAEVENGGLFELNITLEALPEPETPFAISGWVFYEGGSGCDNPVVDVTNQNTGRTWQAETHTGYSYYQLILDTANVSVGDVLEFNATDGTGYNVTTHTVIQSDLVSDGLSDFNLTLSVPAASPTVDSITITPDDDVTIQGVQINPYPGGAKTVTVTVVVSDPGGYGDINTVNITDINPDPAHGDVSPVTLVYQSGSGSGTTATYNTTFDMQFYDAPTEYTVTVVAEDTGGLSGTNSSTFNYTSCTAMSLDSGTIAFGSIDPGENNTVAGDIDMGTTGSPTVRNIGNVEIDVKITGTNMTSGGDTITKDCLDAQVAALGYLDLGLERCFDVNMTSGTLSLENVDFMLNVPYGTPAGSYTGYVTLTTDTC